MSIRYRGRITSWKLERGFGFIKPSDPGEDVFVHVSSLANGRRTPIENEIVTYTIKVDSQGRPQAHDVHFLSDWYSVSPPFGIAASFLLVLTGLVLFGTLPFAVLALYSIASLIAFLAYARDKAAAQQHRRRTAENTLHLLALCGGWPGALIAQHVFRHKTRKRSFILSFWGTVAINCGTLAMASLPAGWQFLPSLFAIIGP